MNLSGIIRYTAAAGLFALAACCAWAILRIFMCHGKKIPLRREGFYLLTIAYLAALIQITALRIGLVSPDWLGGSIAAFPFRTTFREALSGLWPLIYHVIGNMIWFVPLGMILPAYSGKWKAWRVLLCGAVLSLLIECIQYILGTGISDIDDIILNAAGAVSGFYIRRFFLHIKKSFNK